MGFLLAFRTACNAMLIPAITLRGAATVLHPALVKPALEISSRAHRPKAPLTKTATCVSSVSAAWCYGEHLYKAGIKDDPDMALVRSFGDLFPRFTGHNTGDSSWLPR